MIKKTLLITLLGLLLTISTNAQHLEAVWVKQIGNTNASIYLANKNAILQSSNEHIFLSNYLENVELDSALNNGGYLLEFHPDGNLETIKYMGAYTNILFCKDNQNNYLNSKWSSESQYYVIYLSKYDANFNLIWELEFNTLWTLFFQSTGVKSIKVDTLDNIYMFFSPNQVLTILPTGDTIFERNFIAKISPDGVLLNTYVLPIYNYTCDFDIQGNDSLFYVVEGNKSLFEFNTLSEITHQRYFNSIIYNFSVDNFSFYVTDMGSDTLYGNTASDTITHNNLFFHKLDNSFLNVWNRRIDGYVECLLPYPQVYRCRSDFKGIRTLVTDDNLYLYGAFKYKMSIENDTFYTLDSSKFSYFIMKFDKNGTYHWTEVFQSQENITQEDGIMMELILLNDNTLLSAIIFETFIQIGDSTYTAKGNYDMLIMRLQETGTGLKPIQENNAFSFELYPNPANDIVNIEISTDENILTGKLKIYNFLGTMVYERPVRLEKGNDNISFNISHLPQGLYFVSLETPHQKAVKKLVKY